MLQNQIPALRSKILFSNDYSDNCTVVVSNPCRKQHTHNPICDNETALIQLSTDIGHIASDGDDMSANIPIGIFVPQHTLPWGCKSTDKTTAK